MPGNNSNNSIPRAEKCLIKNLDTRVAVRALFNPKELTIEKSVPWNKHKTSKGDNPVLEFTDAEPRSLTVELFFDTYESRANVYEEHIQDLESFTLIMSDSANAAKKRPPMCLFVWGSAFPSFMGVIESLTTKYTMFLDDGTPVRATCQLKMKQADALTKANDKQVPIDQYEQPGRVTTAEDSLRADAVFPDDHRSGLAEVDSDDGLVPTGSTAPGRR